MRKLISIIAISVSASCIAVQANASTVDSAAQELINVTGYANIKAKPTQATFKATFETENANAAIARQIIDANVARAIDQLTANGVDSLDITNLDMKIRPHTVREKGKVIFEGFKGSRTLNVLIRDMTNTETLLDVALKAGATGISSLNYSVEDPSAYESAARTAAAEDAYKKATDLAQALNVKVGKITLISYNGQPVRHLQELSFSDGLNSKAMEPTYANSDLSFSDSVNVTFTIIQPK
jgi:uncharacterized protein